MPPYSMPRGTVTTQGLLMTWISPPSEKRSSAPRHRPGSVPEKTIIVGLSSCRRGKPPQTASGFVFKTVL